MGIQGHLTCLLRNLYAGQEATVRTGRGTTDWFQIGKELCQGCVSSLCLFNLYTEYITRNAGLDEAQTRIKIDGRNINNFKYADDITLMAECEQKRRASWWKWKRRVKKPSVVQKTKIMASGPITSWQIDGETMETVMDFLLGGFKITVDSHCSHGIKRCLLLGRKVMTNLDTYYKSETSLCNQRSVKSKLWFFQ